MNLTAVKRMLKKASKQRPVLGGIHYDVDDGLMEVCDLYNLIQESVYLSITHDLVIDINTGKELDLLYPETKRVKPAGERIQITKDDEKTLTLKIKNDKKCYECKGFYWDAKLIDNAFACLDKKPLEVLTKEENTLFIIPKAGYAYLIYENQNTKQYILSMGFRNN